MGTLDGQVAIITGAGTGIGRASAIKFAQAGAKVVAAGRRKAPLDEVVDEITSAGGVAQAVSVDIADGDAAAEFGRSVLAEHGKVDVLVNNAGYSSKVRTFSHVDPGEFDAVFRVNVEGVYRLTQALLASMIENGGGTVITVSSMAALNAGLLGGVPYSAAKAASLNLMKGLNSELGKHGIRACSVVPGEVDTPILDNRPLPPDETARATMMQSEDVADAILLCAAMPGRTLVEQINLLPTVRRDVSADLAAAAAKATAD